MWCNSQAISALPGSMYICIILMFIPLKNKVISMWYEPLFTMLLTYLAYLFLTKRATSDLLHLLSLFDQYFWYPMLCSSFLLIYLSCCLLMFVSAMPRTLMFCSAAHLMMFNSFNLFPLSPLILCVAVFRISYSLVITVLTFCCVLIFMFVLVSSVLFPSGGLLGLK